MNGAGGADAVPSRARSLRSRPTRRRPVGLAGGLAALVLAVAILVPARHVPAQRGAGAGYAVAVGDSWHFTMPDRRVKVVLLAGSIGAHRDQPYSRLLQEACANVEIRNLSVVGMGAPQLYTRFRNEVLRGGTVRLGDESLEFWLMWNGGLNSAASSTRTNRAIRRAFVAAHGRGMSVVGLTLTPWGELSDRRWRGATALRTLRSTRSIVDFVMGRLTPSEALGSYVGDRDAPEAPWDPSELADVRVDLYNSALRDVDAAPRDAAQMRALLDRDRTYQRGLEALSEPDREARIASDVGLLSELPRWFVREAYRGFDHIHPNREGHALMARTVCPSLPASWGCDCATLPADGASGDASSE